MCCVPPPSSALCCSIVAGPALGRRPAVEGPTPKGYNVAVHLGPLGTATLAALLLQQLLPEGRAGTLAHLVPHPPESVLVPAGELVMGSTAADQLYAYRLCVSNGFLRCSRRLFVNEGPPRNSPPKTPHIQLRTLTLLTT